MKKAKSLGLMIGALLLCAQGTAGAQTPSAAPAASTPPQSADQKDSGFVSKKTGKSLADSPIEDITNDNFPDMIESFDYPNADIADVIKAISELTGKNFIVDTNVRGKITIIAPTRITVAEAYKAFLSALAINNLAVVPGDGFYKIKQARSAQRDNIETYSGAYYPTSDQMITRIIKLKYVSAEEINKQVRLLTSTQGEIYAYGPTNSLIISDYGANIDRVVKIIDQLDTPGFEERMEVIRIRYARAKDIQDLLSKIIDKDSSSGGNAGGIPRFRRTTPTTSTSSSGSEVYSVVVADERTNSIIVVGNRAGISKIKQLISRLDFRLRADENGGVFVYYVKHSDAEQLANTLNGIASESKKAQEETSRSGAPPLALANRPGGEVTTANNPVFGGDVKVISDKVTNSLIITAGKTDYDIIKTILSKVDIPRDQVFLKAVIMEMNSSISKSWGVNYYKFDKDSNGIGRIGFSNGNLAGLLNPASDTGGVLGFGLGNTFELNIPGLSGSTTTGPIKVADITGMINILQANGVGNVLSTPQVTVLNNEEAMIEVGEKVPVAVENGTTTAGITQNSVRFENVTTKLTITPYLSPGSDRVRMKVDQDVAGLSQSASKSGASELAKIAVATTTRKIKTAIVVDSGDTAVLGGLMKDELSDNTTKIPILGDIPILGWLFKSTKKDTAKSNLVVFITPKIIRNEEDNASVVDKKINERIDFIQKYMNGQDPHGAEIDALPRRVNNAPQDEQVPEEPAIETF
jgi:general secretion pathway protein D